MDEINNQNNPIRSEKILKNIFEIGGAIFIILIVIVSGIMVCIRTLEDKNDKQYIKLIKESKVNYFEIPIKNVDTNYIVLSKDLIFNLNQKTDSINSKIEQINEVSSNLEKIQKENTESFIFYITLIGFIFAIVGFFGFKSIFDTRQAAIERAVFDAKLIAESKAKEIAELEAKKISGEKAKEVAEEISKTESQKTAKSEIKKYFDDKFDSEITNRLDKFYDNREERITKIEDNIDKIQRPDAYGLVVEDKDLSNVNAKIIEIEKRYIEILSLVSELKKKEL